jgi:hypothetical protein
MFDILAPLRRLGILPSKPAAEAEEPVPFSVSWMTINEIIEGTDITNATMNLRLRRLGATRRKSDVVNSRGLRMNEYAVTPAMLRALRGSTAEWANHLTTVVIPQDKQQASHG